MKKMLIIGNGYPGIKSIKWEEALKFNITDYQIVLIDLNDCPYDSPPATDITSAYLNDVTSLLENGHTVIYFLRREGVPSNILPFNMNAKRKIGQTLRFSEGDGIISLYRNFVSQHEVVLQNVQPVLTMKGNSVNTELVISNNISEVCGLKWKKLYILPPPDKKHQKEAIESLISYFSPDLEEEKEDKYEWVNDYELSNLGLMKIDNEINLIVNDIVKLEEKRIEKEKEKENIAKWSDLISRQAKTLEIRIKEAFEFLGVDDVQHEPKGSHGPDLVITHMDKFFTIEVEGCKGPIRIDKARELLHWIAEAPTDHKGVLICNPFRELPPDKRPPENQKLFVKETEELALKRDFALINTFEIFKLVCKKINGEELNIDDIVIKIYNGKGLINLT